MDMITKYEKGETVTEEAMDLLNKNEEVLVSNSTSLIEYLNYWAAEDIGEAISKSNKAKIMYIIFVISSIIIFTLISIVIIKRFTKEMKSSINTTLGNIENIIKGIKDRSSDVDNRAEVLSTVSVELSNAVGNSHDSIENITNSVEEQAKNLKDVNDILALFSDSI